MSETRDTGAEHARRAAALDADVGREQIADIYAEALLRAAEKAGRTEAVLADLDAVVGELLDVHPHLEALLASPLAPHEEKQGLLDRLLGGQIERLLLNFLKVVSRRGRLDCLRAIRRQARLQYDRLRGRVAVQLTTAAPLDDEAAERLKARLQSALGAEPILTRRVDPGLIGGAVVRVGDTVYDGSVASQLELVRQQMIDRSVHEIQSRRDRFRDPAGS